jgi:hypothetical protein
MKVAIIGCNGSMGKRYTAILKHLGIKSIGYDIGDIIDCGAFDKAIVCTPTDQHYFECAVLIKNKKHILCEKPISTSPLNIEKLIEGKKLKGVNAHMVSNWRYVHQHMGIIHSANRCEVEYDFYNTGKDGFLWNCIQLVYLAKKRTLAHKSPVFKCRIDGIEVSLQDIEHSYIHMIKDWLGDCKYLWTLEEGLEATQKVRRLVNAYYDSSKNQ